MVQSGGYILGGRRERREKQVRKVLKIRCTSLFYCLLVKIGKKKKKEEEKERSRQKT